MQMSILAKVRYLFKNYMYYEMMTTPYDSNIKSAHLDLM